MRFSFMLEEKAFPVRWMCKRLEVSCSGFYAWRARPESEHARRDRVLGVSIAAVHSENRGVYGSPRIYDELQAKGEAVSKKRVARLMREKGLTGKAPRRFRRTTDSSHGLPVAENILARNFTVDRPNEVWVGDITYVRTWEGWLYVAVVLDLYSRRVVGWAVADHMRTDLALDALKMAIDLRNPGSGLIYHSDRGSQYASLDYRAELHRHGISRKGDCWDNAVAESFFATLKGELIERECWPTKARARAAIIEYIACFYNSKRSHSVLGYTSPMEYEMSVRRWSAVA
jgi:putative transposase